MCTTNAVDLEKYSGNIEQPTDDGHDTSNIITLHVSKTLVL